MTLSWAAETAVRNSDLGILVTDTLLMTLKLVRWLYNPHVMSGCGGSAWDHERSFTGSPVGDAPI